MLGIFILLSIYGMALSDNTSYPDINELFPSFNHTPSNMSSRANTFDIRKIDVNRLKNKMAAFNTSADEISEDTRRQVLVYSFMGKPWYMAASDHMTRQKTTDLMLQTIYMARHIMKQLEADPNFNNKDTGYRIGYLYRKLRRMLKKLNDIFSIMHNHRYGWFLVERHLKLHHMAVKIHTDFLYYWWVLIKVDGKYREANYDTQKLPKTLVKTGGISEERYKIG